MEVFCVGAFFFFLILAGAALVLNSPEVCLFLTSGTGDCSAPVTRGVTICIPGSPGKAEDIVM